MYNGFIETTDKKYIEKHAEEIWNIMQRSYANIGGFKAFSTIEEMLLRVTLLRYGLNNEGIIISAAIYDNKKGIREIPQAYYDFITSIYGEIINNYMNKRSVKLRTGLLRTTKLMLSWMKIIPEGNMEEVAHKIEMPILGKIIFI